MKVDLNGRSIVRMTRSSAVGGCVLTVLGQTRSRRCPGWVPHS